jgi:anti-sigma regulatory factor (Ser/Thr protein kinase)
MQTTLPGEESRLQDAMAFLHGFWQTESLPDELLFPFELALEEVFMNVAMHGGGEQGPATVWLELERADGRLNLSLSDDGRAFDPLALPTPDLDAPLEERPVGGLGVYLVREMMDDVSYSYRDGRNCLSMWKSL